MLRKYLILSLIVVSCSSDVDYGTEYESFHDIEVNEDVNSFSININDVKDKYFAQTDKSILGPVSVYVDSDTYTESNVIYLRASSSLVNSFYYPEKYYDASVQKQAQAVEVSSLTGERIKKGIVISIPAPEPMLITTSYLVILYKYHLGGEDHYGLHGEDRFTKTGDTVTLTVNFYGTFQAVYIDQDVDTLHPVSEYDSIVFDNI